MGGAFRRVRRCFTQKRRVRNFCGLLAALVVATPGAAGDIAVTFTAEGLPPATAHLTCESR